MPAIGVNSDPMNNPPNPQIIHIIKIISVLMIGTLIPTASVTNTIPNINQLCNNIPVKIDAIKISA